MVATVRPVATWRQQDGGGGRRGRAGRRTSNPDLPPASSRSAVIRRSRILPSQTRPRPVPTELRMCQERILLSGTLALS